MFIAFTRIMINHHIQIDLVEIHHQSDRSLKKREIYLRRLMTMSIDLTCEATKNTKIIISLISKYFFFVFNVIRYDE